MVERFEWNQDSLNTTFTDTKVAHRRELLQGKREKKTKKGTARHRSTSSVVVHFSSQTISIQTSNVYYHFFSTSYFQMNTQNVVTAYEVLAAFELTSPLK